MSSRIATRLAAGLAAAALAGSAPAAPTVDLGMAGLLHVARVTVVYPSKPAGGVEDALRSAYRRAAFLERRHGVETAVVADDRVTAAELAGDLLVLGWTNSLIEKSRAALGIRNDAAGVAFAGLVDSDPDADLAFVHASPYAEGKRLYFWSRIDPELDRFMVLPAVGSDWAFYHDYRVVRQGMFSRGSAWPPERDEYAEMDHAARLAEKSASDRRRSSAHYDLVLHAADAPDADLATILAAREAALAEAVRYLGPAPDGFRVALEVYADAEDARSWTGVGAEAYSVPRARALHMTLRYALSESPHEEVHLLARARLGATTSTALYEGLAYARDGILRGRPLALHAAMAGDANGALPTIDDLLDEETLRALPEPTAFAMSGLLVRWLRDTAPERFAEIYGIRWPDAAAVARALGTTREDAENAFRRFTASLTAEQATEVAFRKALETARERHLASDYPGLVTALRRAVALRPDDPQVRFDLASAQMRTGAYAEAEANLKRVLDAGLRPDDPLVPFGHYQLGRLYDLEGRREDAIGEYRRVLALPDVHDSHRSARDGLAAPFTADRLE